MYRTVVFKGESQFDAIVRAGMRANETGDNGFCLCCDICGQPIHEHESRSDCDVWLREFGFPADVDREAAVALGRGVQ